MNFGMLRMQDCSSSKSASIDGVGFLKWHHTLKMAAMTSTGGPRADAAYEAAFAGCRASGLCAVPDPCRPT